MYIKLTFLYYYMDKMNPIKKGIVYGLVIYTIMNGLFIGAFNLGTYSSSKSYFINESIKGRRAEVLTLIENRKEPAYRTLIEKVFDLSSFDFASDIAERRFKAGKFDKIIEENQRL